MRRRKIYYVPGFISLLGLPVLLFFMGPEDVKVQTRLVMVLPPDKKPPEWMQYFSQYTVYGALKKKKIIQVNLGEPWGTDELLDIKQAKQNFIVSELERLRFTNDTNTVLKITMGSENTYGEFIWLVNKAVIYKFKRYALQDNAFYYFPDIPPDYSPPQELKYQFYDM